MGNTNARITRMRQLRKVRSPSPALWVPISEAKNQIEFVNDSFPEVLLLCDPRDTMIAPVVRDALHDLFHAMDDAKLVVEIMEDKGEGGDTNGKEGSGKARCPQLYYRWDERWVRLKAPWAPKDMTGGGVKSKTIVSRLKMMFRSDKQPPLLPHQLAILDRFEERRCMYGINVGDLSEQEKGFLLMWSMGSGKTRGASELVCMGAPKRVVVVAHITNLVQWKNTLKKMYQRAGTFTHFLIVGQTQLSKLTYENPSFLRGAVVIVDEVQYYRNLTMVMRRDADAIRRANQVICLSGTPLVNSDDDMAGFLRVVLGYKEQSIDRWFDRFHNESKQERNLALRELRVACEGRISVYDPKVNDPEVFAKMYPVITEKYVPVALTWDQIMLHQFEETEHIQIDGKRLPLATHNSYHTHTRNVMITSGTYPTARLRRLAGATKKPKGKSTTGKGAGEAKEDQEVMRGDDVMEMMNHEQEVSYDDMTDTQLLCAIWNESPKVQAIVKGLSKYFPEPQVVHSHFVVHGAYLVAAVLRWKYPSWRVEMITGETRGDIRHKKVTEFSEGKIHVLIITDASATGTDVHGARAMWKMGIANNVGTERQTIGRVARFGSHKEGQPLDIYTMIASFGNKIEKGPVPHHVRSLMSDMVRDMAALHRATIFRSIQQHGVNVDDVLIQMGLMPDKDGDYEVTTFEQDLLTDIKKKQKKIDILIETIQSASIPIPRIPVAKPQKRPPQPQHGNNTNKVVTKKMKPLAQAKS